MQNNPYSKENIERRLKQASNNNSGARNFSSALSSAVGPVSRQLPADGGLSRYQRDYYVHGAARDEDRNGGDFAALGGDQKENEKVGQHYQRITHLKTN